MIDVEKVKYPIRLFCPAEDSKVVQTINNSRELQTCLNIAVRLGQPYRLNEETGKFFLGHLKNWQPNAEPVLIQTKDARGHWSGDGKGFVKVTVIPQHYPDSCGQTSVAMAINTLKGLAGTKAWDDDDVHNKYGYGLLAALKGETGKDWTSPDFSPALWDLIEYNLDCGYPVLFAANGPDFSASGHGHVLLIYQLQGKGREGKVYFADPNRGVVTVRTRAQCEDAPPHPQGKWLMLVKSEIGK